MLMTTYSFDVVAMGNLLSHRCVPVGCFHVFDSRCLQMAPVRQSRDHSVPRFLANRLRGQSTDHLLTNGQRGAVILSHGFITKRPLIRHQVQIARQQGTRWAIHLPSYRGSRCLTAQWSRCFQVLWYSCLTAQWSKCLMMWSPSLLTVSHSSWSTVWRSTLLMQWLSISAVWLLPMSYRIHGMGQEGPWGQFWTSQAAVRIGGWETETIFRCPYKG